MNEQTWHRLLVAIGFGIGLTLACAHEEEHTCEGDCECAGNDCICPAAGDCTLDCTEDCDLQCAGSGACDFACDVGCNARCTGNGACVVDAGDDSTVDCPGNGSCDIACHGDCDVSCTMGSCIVRCLAEDDGAMCSLTGCPSDVVDCPDHPDHVRICGGSCPPADG